MLTYKATIRVDIKEVSQWLIASYNIIRYSQLQRPSELLVNISTASIPAPSHNSTERPQLPLKHKILEVICRFIIANFINTFYPAEPHARDKHPAQHPPSLRSKCPCPARFPALPPTNRKEKGRKKENVRQSTPKAVLGYLKME
jgi:hypothetical protein